MRIQVVEDEVRLARHVSRALTNAGHEVNLVHDGESALRDAKETRFQLIVLDVMLPGMDGFEVLRQLRKAHVDSRVLILTARGELNDRVNGLALGADDYLAKPFAMQELVARVAALGRRYAEKAAVKLQVGDLTLDLADNELHRGTRRIELSARELTLLWVLISELGGRSSGLDGQLSESQGQSSEVWERTACPPRWATRVRCATPRRAASGTMQRS